MRRIILLLAVSIALFLPVLSFAQSPDDETALFTGVAPDALLILDLSGSMSQTAAGDLMYTSSSNACSNPSSSTPFYASSTTGYTTACSITNSVPIYSNSTCSGPFYMSSRTGYTTDCSKLAMAKRAIFSLLDDNADGTINSQDQATLNIRFGLMTLYNCSADDSSNNYSSGCNKVIRSIGTVYSQIYCGSTTSCTASSTGSNSVNSFSASGGTPLAGTLHKAKVYLDYTKSVDTAAACRQKFAIIITDGADTYACSGTGDDNQQDQYKRRREVVARAQELANAGYKLFVIGFGSQMPHWLFNTLNWMAYYGGTDNPASPNSGDITAYNPSSYPIGSCTTSTTAQHNILGDGNHYYATSGDPGELSLSGYAFFAANPTDLQNALNYAIDIIRQATYSFSQVSVQSTRTQDENSLYEGSFQEVVNDPFWLGHLQKYAINTDGTVGSLVWDAGPILQAQDPSTRNMYTALSGSILAFTTANIAPATVGASTTSVRDSIVGYVQGVATYNPDNWKLGDIFRSTPVTVGTPSQYYYDPRDKNNAFSTYRSNNTRSSANGLRLIVAGANDGQMHAFKTSAGSEAWSFIPPNLLPKFQYIAHSTHPTSLTHAYFVDGPATVADVWTGTGDGTHKQVSEWQTMLVLAEGRGASNYLWSSAVGCDSGFNASYNTTYPYYCGYHALNITSTLSPTYKWKITPSAAQAPYLGDPWSKMMIAKVLDGGNERWVGFIGGGYNGSNCSSGTCDTRGKGFYIIDLITGNVIWSYTYANNSNLIYSMPSSPAIVDTDNDGFIDTVYLGDLGGNMWRFKLCRSSDANCSVSTWSGSLFYNASTTGRPIYTTAAVARDTTGNIWVYWGTGDKMNETVTTAQDLVFAVKDDRASTFSISSLVNVTSSTYVDSATGHGWYMNLPGLGEKVLPTQRFLAGSCT